MNTYVAFMRAINVGGHACVKMSHLRDTFTSAGCRDVRTYIQSGNVLFEAPAGSVAAIIERVGGQLRTVLGKEPDIMLRTAGDIEVLVNSAPFKDVEAEPGVKLYVAFLLGRPRSKRRLPLVSSAEALEVIRMSNLDVLIVSRRKKNGSFAFPNSFIEEQLDVLATTRNWSTVRKMADLARREAGG